MVADLAPVRTPPSSQRVAGGRSRVAGPRHGTPRWMARQALRNARLPAGPKGLAFAIIDAMNDDGTLPAHVGRREVMRRAGISAPTFCRHMKILEAAGLFTRTGTGRISPRTGRYAHVIVIALASRFHFAPAADQRNYHRRLPDLRSYQSDNPTPHKSGTEGPSVVQAGEIANDRYARGAATQQALTALADERWGWLETAGQRSDRTRGEQQERWARRDAAAEMEVDPAGQRRVRELAAALAAGMDGRDA